MSAELAIQKAIVAALHGSAAVASVVSGIFDGPPPRAAFPYLSVSNGATGDWSTKTARGRELRAAVTVWDDGETPARFHQLLHDVEAAIAAVGGEHDGWRVATNVFARSLVSRDPDGPWAGLIEFRIRVLEI